MEQDAPLVAICMATHEPDATLLRRQIDSIKHQTHSHFVCLIGDDHSSESGWSTILDCVDGDPRFTCLAAEERGGFYRNFERVLSRVPADATYVALSDQDDYWYPEKVARLLAALADSDADLAYCDMRIVSNDGDVVSPSFFADRPNNRTDLTSMLIANSVTGAASMFRRELLIDALPFPNPIGAAFHDQWLACVALARGDLAYVDRPLQDYVRHGANVTDSGIARGDLRSGVLAALQRLVSDPRRRIGSTIRNAGAIYEGDLKRVELFARTIEVRLDGRIDRRRARDLRRLSRLRSSPRTFAWLVVRSLVDVHGRSPSRGAEIQLAKGVIWGWCRAGRGGNVRRWWRPRTR